MSQCEPRLSFSAVVSALVMLPLDFLCTGKDRIESKAQEEGRVTE